DAAADGVPAAAYRRAVAVGHLRPWSARGPQFHASVAQDRFRVEEPEEVRGQAIVGDVDLGPAVLVGVKESDAAGGHHLIAPGLPPGLESLVAASVPKE